MIKKIYGDLLAPLSLIKGQPEKALKNDDTSNPDSYDNNNKKLLKALHIKKSLIKEVIFKSAHFLSIATDAHGVIQLFNVGAQNMLGYKVDEVVNKFTLTDISDPQERITRATALSKELETPITPDLDALVFKASRGIEDVFELTYIHKNGNLLPTIVSITALRNKQNTIMGYLLIGTDNTAHKHAEDTLRKLSLAVEQNPNSIVITDLHANIEYVNEAFIKTSGYHRDELIGKNQSQLSSKKTSQIVYKTMWEQLKIGKSWQGEFINKAKQGHEYTELALISPIRQPDGKITHYLGIKENITESKQNQAILLAAIVRAESLAKSKAQFFATMSHEIRTPMNGIINFSELALLHDMPDNIRDYLKKINNASLGLLNILNDILDLSKLEAGAIHINIEHFAIDELIDDLHGLFMEASKQKGLSLTLIMAPGVPRYLLGDKLRLEQVLINLLGNAIKFTASGSVTLNITLQQLIRSQAKLLFAVTDTGIGISAADQNKLFRPFSQVDDSITRRFGGTGLGLALSHNMIQLMGGEFSVNSRLGQGSQFSFTLTLGVSSLSNHTTMINRSETLSSTLSSYSQQLTSIQVLVVEDNIFNQQIIDEFLTLSGVSVKTANNGQEALIALEHTEFDAVLMDIHMPVMDGIEAIRRIRRLPRFRALPVIALTAGVTEEERKRCLTAGMNDFITKPINPTLLLSTLAHWLKLADTSVTTTDATHSLDDFNEGLLMSITDSTHLDEQPLPAKVTSISDPLLTPTMDPDMCVLRELVGDDPDTLAKFLGYFHISATAISSDIITAISTGQVIAASNAAHKLSASARSVGAIGLGDLCMQIEDAGKAGDGAMLNTLLLSFEKEWALVEKYLLTWPG
ncbi:MAG: hypothetical protein RIQ94_6 [Pseudomonadota bacterium]|jgi:PAS domain S-box-containing protein